MLNTASLIFMVFSALYALISAAVVYHLKEYTLPVERAPKIVTAIFITTSAILWILALIFLLL